ncbi:glycoside hydrolase family 95 protein [Neolewinella persica]|uniref:glycoside hydrolase family 95 protein n=1 Tax=Neolewinella persica TaxID=70998 RepID=UPI00036BF371|nr:glycoside hydrolase family 95 protein [Neolewinella persica]
MQTRFILLILISTICSALKAQSTHELWFDEPATAFEETLVLGNGRVGASVFGGMENDSIFLNDATLWSGEPVDPNMNPGARTALPAIRAALKAENYRLADSLQRGLQGSFSQSYAPLGTLHLAFQHPLHPRPRQKKAVSNYRRSLDIDRAIVTQTYSLAGVDFSREYFVSHPDKVMVIRLKASQTGALSFDLGFTSQLPHTFDPLSTDLAVNGYAPYHAEPSYRGDIPNAVRFDPARGTRFTSRFRIKSFDGRVSVEEEKMRFIGGTEAIILVSISTSFNGFDKDPAREGLDHKRIAETQLQQAAQKTVHELRTNHLRDHQSFFRRLSLDLGPTNAPDLPTDERLKRYGTGVEDKNLEILYLQYGRYLLISSSRTPEVPANLQGIWNPYLRPPWSANYTININAEENYWPAEVANLSEMHQPMLGFIENVARTGAITARTFYGTDGWVACHNSDIWAMSNPVGDFGQGDPNWANWNMGGVWLSTHLWEHYLFTRDEAFLRTKAYPILKGATRFCLDWLTEGPQGELLTSPSTSPEARFITSDGYAGSTLYGGSADMAFIRENFAQTLAAGEILGMDPGLQSQIKAAQERLLPYKISKNGHLQEWYHDWEDQDPRHRHQTHLFGLHPGHHLSPEKTPELAAASRKTLEIKGDETTGWSKGWRINLWARLWDGNRAYKMLRELLRYVEPTGKTGGQGGGTYPNLFDAHPPFQIDGNFGGAAAILEMIVQSGPNEIRLLPALPDAWPEGTLRGVRTRTGHEVDISWKDNKITAVTLHAFGPGSIQLITGASKQEVFLTTGSNEVEF